MLITDSGRDIRANCFSSPPIEEKPVRHLPVKGADTNEFAIVAPGALNKATWRKSGLLTAGGKTFDMCYPSWVQLQR